ncbi:MraY family glycosyltransferase [Desertivirga xinjiangensis]|uniref:MraY family glycosyltransferase n=1 Tax=Desertivirga xinjiangensis TaxID=539206 RepID=UPI00210BF6E6|nr:glycosyltransferase family 4 protein [Pedobacter xinjiangensis]
MPDYIIYSIIFISLTILELSYFYIAEKFNIIDRPNHRSSHTKLTIRGGGIIFPIAVLIWFFVSGFAYPLFVTGLVLISGISFRDDIDDLHSGIRTVFQFLAVGLLLAEVHPIINWYYYIILFIAIVGTKNAYNFMDGINGITGLYSLVTLTSLGYVNQSVTGFTSMSLITMVILALLVFNFFNFRRQAKCFAGDVGSVSIAFTIIFFLIQLIVETGSFIYVSFLLVYGIDTVTTIFFRLVRKENILEAHRTHFYQFLANEKKWPHLKVSALYSLIQLVFNIIVIALRDQKNINDISILLTFGLVIMLLFIFVRFSVEGRQRLLGATLG